MRLVTDSINQAVEDVIADRLDGDGKASATAETLLEELREGGVDVLHGIEVDRLLNIALDLTFEKGNEETDDDAQAAAGKDEGQNDEQDAAVR